MLSAEVDVLCAFFTIGSELIPHFRSRAHKSAEITVSIRKTNNHPSAFNNSDDIVVMSNKFLETV